MSQQNIDNINDWLDSNTGKSVKRVFQEELVPALNDKADLVGGKIPVDQIPLSMNDYREGYYKISDGLMYQDSSFTILLDKSTDVLYLDLNTTNTYRWTGTVYLFTGTGALSSQTKSGLMSAFDKKKLDKKVYTFDTVAEAQASAWLVEGDIIECLGYYEKGDGGGHKRVYASTDDGSGEPVVGGGYLNLISHKVLGYIDPKWVGAKLDGTTDDSEFINKAKSIFRTIKLIDGICFIDTNVLFDFGTNLYFENSKFKLGTNGKIIIKGKIYANEEIFDFDLNVNEPQNCKVGIDGLFNKEITPIWFGAKIDGITDDTESVNKAIYSSTYNWYIYSSNYLGSGKNLYRPSVNPTTIKMPNGISVINGSIVHSGNFTSGYYTRPTINFEGENCDSTILLRTDLTNTSNVFEMSYCFGPRTNIGKFKVSSGIWSVNNLASPLMYFSSSNGITFRDCWISGAAKSIFIGSCSDFYVNNVWAEHSTIGFHLSYGTVNMTDCLSYFCKDTGLLLDNTTVWLTDYEDVGSKLSQIRVTGGISRLRASELSLVGLTEGNYSEVGILIESGATLKGGIDNVDIQLQKKSAIYNVGELGTSSEPFHFSKIYISDIGKTSGIFPKSGLYSSGYASFNVSDINIYNINGLPFDIRKTGRIKIKNLSTSFALGTSGDFSNTFLGVFKSVSDSGVSNHNIKLEIDGVSRRTSDTLDYLFNIDLNTSDVRFNNIDRNNLTLGEIYTTGATYGLLNNKVIRMNIAEFGTTANRPSANIGFQYFDTTLNKPIWWNGSVWKDANGTTV